MDRKEELYVKNPPLFRSHQVELRIALPDSMHRESQDVLESRPANTATVSQ